MTGFSGTPPYTPSPRPLDVALTEARKHGWAVLERSISQVTQIDLLLNLGTIAATGVPHRRGGKLVATLKPTPPEEAPARSLSATHGTGAFPFHTDGAYMKDPPEFVLLEAFGAPSSVPTTLIRYTSVQNMASVQDLTLGLFRVQEHGGRASYRPALEAGKFRFDAECMSAADPRSRRVAASIQKLAPDHEHVWDKVETTLVIHNHSVLHARGTATSEPDRELQRILLNGQH